jgi:hypothetical protein
MTRAARSIRATSLIQAIKSWAAIVAEEMVQVVRPTQAARPLQATSAIQAIKSQRTNG